VARDLETHFGAILARCVSGASTRSGRRDTTGRDVPVAIGCFSKFVLSILDITQVQGSAVAIRSRAEDRLSAVF
jgi:hypothetical protein